ncbi:MAG: hypothetical protein Q7R50_01770 [Dehalococcoidales bacterium]|nr:hypothetical protein [Dehalococcoidales bacterium]
MRLFSSKWKATVVAGLAIAVMAAIIIFVYNPDKNTSDVTFEPYDWSRAADIVSTYDLSYREAIFLAMTKYETKLTGGNTYEIDATFPTGNTGHLTVEILPDQVYQPAAGEAVMGGAGGEPRVFGAKFSSREKTDGFSFRLEYFVPNEDLPEDTVKQLRSVVATRPERNLLAFLFPLGYAQAQEPGSMNGVQVVVEGAVEAYTDSQIGNFEQFIGKELDIAGVKDGAVTTTIGSVTSVLDSWDTRTEYLDRKKQLDQLRRCAENPTNPLTIKMYQENPATKQKILDQIELSQMELKSSAAAMFLGTMANVGAGLASEVPGLGILAGAAVNWSQETLNELSDREVENAKKMVSPCKEASVAKGMWTGTITQTTVSTSLISTEGETEGNTNERTETTITTIDVTGVKMETGQDGIVVLAQLTGTLTSSYSMAGSGTGWHLTYCGEGQTTKQVRLQSSSQEKASGKASGEAEIMVTLSLSGQYYGSTSSSVEGEYEGQSSSQRQKCGQENISESHAIGPNPFYVGSIDFSGTTDPTAPVLTGSTTNTQYDTTTTTTWSLTRN